MQTYALEEPFLNPPELDTIQSVFSVCLGEPMVSSSFFIADVGKPDSIYYELTAKYLLRRVVR